MSRGSKKKTPNLLSEVPVYAYICMEPLSELIYEILVTYEPLLSDYRKHWTVPELQFESIQQFTNFLTKCYIRGDMQYFRKLSFLLSEDVIEFDHMELMKKFSPEYLI